RERTCACAPDSPQLPVEVFSTELCGRALYLERDKLRPSRPRRCETRFDSGRSSCYLTAILSSPSTLLGELKPEHPCASAVPRSARRCGLDPTQARLYKRRRSLPLLSHVPATSRPVPSRSRLHRSWQSRQPGPGSRQTSLPTL